jgi:SAM-dependent methyltransferase
VIKRLFFNLWYLRKPPWDTRVSPPELLEYVQHHPPGRALDLGCGTGTNVLTLAKAGWEAVGVDFAGKAISTAKKRARQAGVDAAFFVGDVSQPLDLGSPFDLILDMGCFHTLSLLQRQGYANNLNRWLVPGGHYLLYAFVQDRARDWGLTSTDFRNLERNLQLVKRQDGTERGRRHSAWFEYEKSKPAYEVGTGG